VDDDSSEHDSERRFRPWRTSFTGSAVSSSVHMQSLLGR
jgi:hypothetical protein